MDAAIANFRSPIAIGPIARHQSEIGNRQLAIKHSFRERRETYKLYFAETVMVAKRKKGIVKRGGWEIAKKVLKAIPIIGPVFVVGFAGHDIKRKGLVAGAVHVGLDATPVVGTAKNVVEIFTGDLIPDKADKNAKAVEQPLPRPEGP